MKSNNHVLSGFNLKKKQQQRWHNKPIHITKINVCKMKQSINQKSTALAVVLLVVVSYYNTSAHGGIRAKAVTWF